MSRIVLFGFVLCVSACMLDPAPAETAKDQAVTCPQEPFSDNPPTVPVIGCQIHPSQQLEDRTNRAADDASAGQTVLDRGYPICAGGGPQNTASCIISIQLASGRIDVQCTQHLDDGGISCKSRWCTSVCTPWGPAGPPAFAPTTQNCPQEPIVGTNTICQQQPPPPLDSRTDQSADAWAGANYPDQAYMKTGLSCSFGAAVSSCTLHIHLSLSGGFSFTCTSRNDSTGFRCDAYVDI